MAADSCTSNAQTRAYAGDVAATLLLVCLALRFDHNPDNRAVVRFGGAAGALAVLFSFAAVPTAVVLTMLLGWRSRAAMYPPRSLLRFAGPWCSIRGSWERQVWR
jgi:hypothetical protein